MKRSKMLLVIQRQILRRIAETPEPDVTDEAIASDWASEHVSAADPHDPYLKESVVSGPGTPEIKLDTIADKGSHISVVATDATIAAFDATVPVTQALSDEPAAGSVAFAARRDHRHGMPKIVTYQGDIVVCDGELITAAW